MPLRYSMSRDRSCGTVHVPWKVALCPLSASMSSPFFMSHGLRIQLVGVELLDASGRWLEVLALETAAADPDQLEVTTDGVPFMTAMLQVPR